MAEIIPIVGNITQILTKKHNDLQDRDADDAHPESAVTDLITDLGKKVSKSGDTMTGIPNKTVSFVKVAFLLMQVLG